MDTDGHGFVEGKGRKGKHQTINIQGRQNPHLTLTLSPPIRVYTLTLSLSHQNGRGKRRGNSKLAAFIFESLFGIGRFRNGKNGGK
jgi:hypothetical protein